MERPCTKLSLAIILFTLMAASTIISAVEVPINNLEGRSLINMAKSWAMPNKVKFDAKWTFDLPCINWTAITCDSSGHVIEIDLRGRGIKGPLSANIDNFKYLRSLVLGENYFNGSLPSEIGNLNLLQILDVYMNRFTGIIPSTIGNLKSLKELILGYNNFTGGLPAGLGGLKSLEKLYINNNNLTGFIPSSFRELTSLYDLELSYNAISGNIPSALASMTSLQRLHLRNNKLYGPIPSQLGRLNLLNLFLSGNQLSGPIPDSLGKIYSLQVLALRGNYFTGAIPQSINDLPHLSGRSFGLNCLKYPNSWKGAWDKQRPSAKCNDFCYANSVSGPCGGNGFCFFRKNNPACICKAGFSLGETPKSCVANSIKDGASTSSSISA